MGTYEGEGDRKDQIFYLRVRTEDARRTADMLTEQGGTCWRRGKDSDPRYLWDTMRIETFTVCLQNFLDKFVIDLIDSLGCGAVYLGKTWRRGRRLPPEVMNKA